MAYDAPTPAELKLRYPAFSTVADEDADYWLADAQRYVDTSWGEGDYAPALMAVAAHHMAGAGLVTGAGLNIPAGVERFRSGSFDIAFSGDAVKAQVTGGWGSTKYGQEYLELLARNKGGPRVAAGGAVPNWPCSFNGWAGPIPPYGL
jgi:hypothetical protein